MKRVLVVLEWSGFAGQDRTRGPIFKDLFARHGIQVRYIGRRPPPPFAVLSSSSRPIAHLANSVEYKAVWWFWDAILTRLNEQRIVRISSLFDSIHLIKVGSLDLVERLRRRSSARLVFDLGDALWLTHHAAAYKDLVEVLRRVDAVTCDNRHGLEFASRYNRSLYECPPPSQVELFDPSRPKPRHRRKDGKLVIGWLGSPSTAFNLFVVWEALERLFGESDGLHLRLVGVGSDPALIPNFEQVEVSTVPYYDQGTMIREVLGMDIGIFPMFDVLDSRVRGILKALLYMSGEAAVVCSPRGDCVDLITDRINGMLADSGQQWIDQLRDLVRDEALRKRLTASGLETVRSRYSLDRAFQPIKEALGV